MGLRARARILFKAASRRKFYPPLPHLLAPLPAYCKISLAVSNPHCLEVIDWVRLDKLLFRDLTNSPLDYDEPRSAVLAAAGRQCRNAQPA